MWPAIALLPHPAALSQNAWNYLGLFTAVIVALVLEPIPPAAVGLLGMTLATAFGYISPRPAEAIQWGLRGFSDVTVWLIFGALVFARGYDKTGLGRRIALSLVAAMGKRTLGLGYAVMLADLAIAPFTPSNTGRSAGVIFPIIQGIPALYGSAPGPTARRIGAYLMWTAFASTAVTSSMFLTALGPNLLALGNCPQDHRSRPHLVPVDDRLPAHRSPAHPAAAPADLPHLSAGNPSESGGIHLGEQRAGPHGPASHKEVVMGLLILVAFSLWLFGGAWINPTTVILAVIALLIVTRVLDWDDVIGNRAAWDTLIYFATLLALAEGLERVGIVAWASQGISGLIVGASPVVAILVLVSFFFLVHYMFASLTAHTMAVLPAILAAGAAFPGMPVRVLALLLVYSIGLMGVITPYATGPAPVYFGSGFIPRKDFWVLGFVFGLIYLTTLLAIGIPCLLSGKL